MTPAAKAPEARRLYPPVSRGAIGTGLTGGLGEPKLRNIHSEARILGLRDIEDAFRRIRAGGGDLTKHSNSVGRPRHGLQLWETR